MTELISLTHERYDDAVAIAELPDITRGYEEVRLANIEKFRAAVHEHLTLHG